MNKKDAKILKETAETISRVKEAIKTKESIIRALKDIKIESKVDIPKIEIPPIIVPKPDPVEVKVDVPPIKLPKIVVPKPDPVEVKIPPIKVPAPKVTVKPAEVKFPKEMAVKGLAKAVKPITDALKKPLNAVLSNDRDNPLPVILTDEKGVFYKAVSQIISQGGGGGRVVEERGAASPGIKNKTMTLADTEYSLTIPAGTKDFTVQCRTAHDIRFSYEKGKVATPVAPYGTIKAGTNYYVQRVNLRSDLILYIACSDAGKVAELIYWK